MKAFFAGGSFLGSVFGYGLRPILAAIIGLACGLAVSALAGENPLNVFKILVMGSFGSAYGAGMTLFHATPLVFTGLSVAFAFKAGLFNVGAEGQLAMGALAIAAVGALLPGVPWPVAPIMGVVAGFAAGAIWGALAGWLRAKRGAHEVITTIMLNFIAAGGASYVTLYLLKNPETQNPETIGIGANYFVGQFAVFEGAPVSWALFLALAAVFSYWIFFSRTVWGYEIQAVGQNERASRIAGIDSLTVYVMAMALSGGLAGLVGVAEVMGNAGRFKLGFSPEYGFMGIAVALLGRARPLGVLAAALLFGMLHKGASDLDMETEKVTRDLSMILEAFVILFVSAEGIWDWTKRKRHARNE